MRILIVGSGGREHALAWNLGQEAEVHAAPGNPGFGCECHDIDTASHDEIAALALALQPELVVIGPENPLIEGLANRLRSAGLAVFGPDSAGAQLEGSKAFAKGVMSGAGVSTAKYAVCKTSAEAESAAQGFIETSGGAVVKASGNALGKGVRVCSTIDESREAIHSMIEGRKFGDAGSILVIEECLYGREFSLLTVCSESGIWSLPVAQDYKRAYDGDRGPNTGGMGSFSPVDWVSGDLVEEAEQRVVLPALKHLSANGVAYRGVLFSGLMLTSDGIKCLEYNVRFGDPETQSILRRVKGGLASSLRSAALGEAPIPCRISSDASVAIVLANRGYPGPIEAGGEVTLPDRFEDGVVVFHAGTKLKDGKLIASGGRVLNVTAIGPSLSEARERAMRAVETIAFPGAWCRSDIAASAGH